MCDYYFERNIRYQVSGPVQPVRGPGIQHVDTMLNNAPTEVQQSLSRNISELWAWRYITGVSNLSGAVPLNILNIGVQDEERWRYVIRV